MAGDMIEEYNSSSYNHYGEELQKIMSTYGSYGVLGNHEYYDQADESRQYLINHNCYIMRDEIIPVGKDIILIGREEKEASGMQRPLRKTVAQLLENVDSSKLIILLDH